MFQAHLIISGKVQGVFYRALCQETAQELALTGWVKNLLTGEVEVLAQGEKIEKLIEWCKKGPPSSRVNYVDIKWEKYAESFNNFDIK